MINEDKTAPRYAIPAITANNAHCTWTTVRKSRFLAQTCHCPSSVVARQFITEISRINSQASHNCWAYVAGAPGNSAQIGCSDDGEPHGTAGKPMLSALLGSNIGEICVVVSRWFGGIKLGTGGLVRAYQGAVIDNLATMPVKSFVASNLWHLALPYNLIENFNKSLQAIGGDIINEEYNDIVNYTLTVPVDKSKELNELLNSLNNDKIKISLVNQQNNIA